VLRGDKNGGFSGTAWGTTIDVDTHRTDQGDHASIPSIFHIAGSQPRVLMFMYQASVVRCIVCMCVHVSKPSAGALSRALQPFIFMHIAASWLICYVHYLLNTCLSLSLSTSHRVHRSKQVCVVVVVCRSSVHPFNVKRCGSSLYDVVTCKTRLQPSLCSCTFPHAQLIHRLKLPFLFWPSCCCLLLPPLPLPAVLVAVAVSTMRRSLLINFCTFSYRL
jgi:hypothetical protein